MMHDYLGYNTVKIKAVYTICSRSSVFHAATDWTIRRLQFQHGEEIYLFQIMQTDYGGPLGPIFIEYRRIFTRQ